MFKSLLNRIGALLQGINTKNLEHFPDERDHNPVAQELSREPSDLEDLGALAASIEHDIRNPLMVIQTEITMLKEKRQTDAEAISHIRYIEEQLERIFAVTQIIPYIRGRADFFGQYMEKTRMGDLIQRTVKLVKREIHPTDIYFKYRENNVAFVKAHRPMLERAMTNVLKNAVEAISEARRQGGVIDIELNIDIMPEMVRVDIVDNGCGIPEENIPKLATLFSTKSNKKANSGVGLFITNRILKLHQGKLEIRSKVGEGTTVSIFLPRWKDQADIGPI